MIAARVPTSTCPLPAPTTIDDIARRTALLWSIEPAVPTTRRTELLSALSALEADIDAIQIRHVASVEIHTAEVRRCAHRYLALRDAWGDREIAA